MSAPSKASKKPSTAINYYFIIMIKKTSFITALSFLMPVIALAQTKDNLGTLITKVIGYANQILFLMMGVAIVMFVFYVIKYFIKADANRVDGGKYVMYSVIGFFVILSFWGIVNILQNTFGLKNDTNRPAGWESFMNIFPGGGSSSGGVPRFDQSSQGPAENVNPDVYDNW